MVVIRFTIYHDTISPYYGESTFFSSATILKHIVQCRFSMFSKISVFLARQSVCSHFNYIKLEEAMKPASLISFSHGKILRPRSFSELVRSVRKDRGLNILQQEKQTRLTTVLIYATFNIYRKFSESTVNFPKTFRQRVFRNLSTFFIVFWKFSTSQKIFQEFLRAFSEYF